MTGRELPVMEDESAAFTEYRSTRRYRHVRKYELAHDLEEEKMGKVFLSLSMSLDGYVAGPNVEIETLHDWLWGGDTPSRHGHGLTLSSASREMLDEAFEEAGACVVG